MGVGGQDGAAEDDSMPRRADSVVADVVEDGESLHNQNEELGWESIQDGHYVGIRLGTLMRGSSRITALRHEGLLLLFGTQDRWRQCRLMQGYIVADIDGF